MISVAEIWLGQGDLETPCGARRTSSFISLQQCRYMVFKAVSRFLWFIRQSVYIVPCLALNRTADFSIRNWNRINIICACWPSLKTACLNWEGIWFHVCYLLNSEHDDWNWMYLIATWYESWISFLFCSNTDNLFIKQCNLMYGQSINNMPNEYWMDDSTFANFLDEYSELGSAANYKAVSQVSTFIEYLEVWLINRCGWHWYVSNKNIKENDKFGWQIRLCFFPCH